MPKIALHGKYGEGKLTEVSPEDFDWATKWTWRVSTHGYVVRTATPEEERSGKSHTLFLHREIMQSPKAVLTDHRSGDRLDNRRENLRLCDYRQNAANRAASGAFAAFGAAAPWRAVLHLNRKNLHLGVYKTREDAERAYSSAALFYHGEFANVPYPEETPKTVEQLKIEARFNARRGTSRFMGVFRNGELWQAQVQVNKKTYYIGRFATEEDAAQAYDEAVEKHGLPKWKKNFISDLAYVTETEARS